MEEKKLKSEIYYFDDNDNIVAKDKATKAIIRELDEKGNLVNEIWGNIDPSAKNSREMTIEDYDDLIKR